MATEDLHDLQQEPELNNDLSQTAPVATEEPRQLISTAENAALMDEWWYRRRDPYCV